MDPKDGKLRSRVQALVVEKIKEANTGGKSGLTGEEVAFFAGKIEAHKQDLWLLEYATHAPGPIRTSTRVVE